MRNNKRWKYPPKRLIKPIRRKLFSRSKDDVVSLSQLLKSHKDKSKLTFFLGRDIGGKIRTADLDEIQNLLFAGQTGSGKSKFFNNILTSLLLKNSPDELKLIIIDPKQVEFIPYNNIPHLLHPVITSPDIARDVLGWVRREIDKRYKNLANNNARNISTYNAKHSDEFMSHILITCDEFSDLMMMHNNFFDEVFAEICQKGRAVGVHLILSTSRPSTDVITDKMLGSFHTRIAFTCASDVDSIRIIDVSDAENLRSKGDMLYKAANALYLKRMQAPVTTDDDTLRLTNYLKKQAKPKYISISEPELDLNSSDNDDELYAEALKYVIKEQRVGTALIQRKFQVGYGKAAYVIEKLEENGVIGPADGANPRKVIQKSL